MMHKYKKTEPIQRHKGRRTVLSSKGVFLFTMLTLTAVVLQLRNNNNVQGKTLHRAKQTLKLLQSPSSLIQLRHKRDTFANEQQQPTVDDGDYYDDNYDVLPDEFASFPPATLTDHISAKAKQVAESFTNIWQSLADSVRHCLDGLRAMFGDAVADGDLTPEQEQQILENMDETYRLKQEHDNEIVTNIS